MQTFSSKENNAGSSLRCIDSDVHPSLKESVRSLYPYLSKAWQERFELKAWRGGSIPLTPRFAHPTNRTIRPDTIPSPGVLGASIPEFMERDYFDRWDIDCAILNNIEVATWASALAGPEESVALCSAANDYFLEHWTQKDDRYKYAICVPTQSIPDACNEIRRLGKKKGVVSILLPLMNILMGNNYYYPIYQIAEEYDLPIMLHVNSADFIYQNGQVVTGGFAHSYMERYIDFHLIGQSQLCSLVVNGVFERFPKLKVLFNEYGFTWVVPLMWRMDKAWQGLRIDTPWVKKMPSEYIREHVTFTTQPIDEPTRREDLITMIRMLGPETLMFSTDYPHWDNDPPKIVIQSLPSDVKDMIFWKNATKFFKLD